MEEVDFDNKKYLWRLLRSLDEVHEEINIRMKVGGEFEVSGMYQAAGKSYYEVARLGEIHLEDYEGALSVYRTSAECYLKTQSIDAIHCYERMIDILLKTGKVDRAIEYCVKFGYSCAHELDDTEKGDQFYSRAEEIRRLHNKSHTCSKTKFDPSEYDNDQAKALKDLKDFDVVKPGIFTSQITGVGLCRNCIEAYEQLRQFVSKLKPIQ
ncbi:hypothetical protein RF11_15185 [Thelohanellus kitauei]|uniref:Uncharacterized protein n=1 Tax=Thelohanellus kitauei TaxID=669202 RepID=A0A0C2MZD2_THEKT|nr:hypothetical protein RF11_15185 [Thelohanellus kitauei]